MKKQIILSALFVLALAVFTPAVAAIVSENTVVTAVTPDDKEKKAETKKEATTECSKKKATSECSEKKAAEAKPCCSEKKASSGCEKKSEKK